MKNLLIFKSVTIVVFLSFTKLAVSQHSLIIPSIQSKGSFYTEVNTSFLNQFSQQVDHDLRGYGLALNYQISIKYALMFSHNSLAGKTSYPNLKNSSINTTTLGIGRNYPINPNLFLQGIVHTIYGSYDYSSSIESENTEKYIMYTNRLNRASKFISSGLGLNLIYHKSKLGLALGSHLEVQKFINSTAITTIKSEPLSILPKFISLDDYTRRFWDEYAESGELDLDDIADAWQEYIALDSTYENSKQSKSLDDSYAINIIIQPRLTYGNNLKIFIQPGLHINTASDLADSGKNITAGLSYQFN